MREKEKRQNEWEHERADRALAMEEFEAEIGQREKPAEEGKRAVEIVIRDGVRAAGTLEECEIVGDESENEKDGAKAAGDFAS